MLLNGKSDDMVISEPEGEVRGSRPIRRGFPHQGCSRRTAPGGGSAPPSRRDGIFRPRVANGEAARDDSLNGRCSDVSRMIEMTRFSLCRERGSDLASRDEGCVRVYLVFLYYTTYSRFRW